MSTKTTFPYEGPLPYEACHRLSGGVYRVTVGRFFYIGSTRSLGSRRSDHKIRLEAGTHPCAALQLAFDEIGKFEMTITWLVPEKPSESKEDHRRRLRMLEQIELNAWFGKRGCTNGSSDSGFNTKIGAWLKRKWADPEFRESQVARLKARKGDAVSAETRGRMSLAKQRGRHHAARKCFTTFGGATLHFSCVRDAAEHLGVSQQVMDLWLRGIVAWPGTGRKSRSYGHLEGLTGAYVK